MTSINYILSRTRLIASVIVIVSLKYSAYSPIWYIFQLLHIYSRINYTSYLQSLQSHSCMIFIIYISNYSWSILIHRIIQTIENLIIWHMLSNSNLILLIKMSFQKNSQLLLWYSNLTAYSYLGKIRLIHNLICLCTTHF